MKFIGVVAMSLIFVGCSTTQKFTAPIFPAKLDAKVATLSTADDILPVSRKIEAVDSVILIAGELDGKLMHVYDIRTGKFKGSHINKGQGPDDMVYVGNFITDSIGVTALDLFTSAEKRFDKDWKCISVSRSYTQGMETYAPRVIHLMPDGKRLMQVFVQEHAPLGLMMLKDGKHGDVYTESPLDNDPESEKASTYNRVNFTFSPDATKVAFASREGLIMEIFDVADLNIKPIAIKLFHPYDINTKKMGENVLVEYKEDNIKGIMTMTATDKRIVAAYNGSTSHESNTDIAVWDWNGKPLRRYGFIGRIMALCLSPLASDDIYALVHKSDYDISLVKINCPGLLD